MSPVEIELEDAVNRMERAVREVLRQRQHEHRECTFMTVPTSHGIEIVCQHEVVLVPSLRATRVLVWG